MRRQAAYSFRSPLAVAEMREKLSSVGPWRWIERDNDSWGDYISAGALPEPHFGVVKILSNDDHYELNIVIKTDPDDEADIDDLLSAVRATVLDSILPTIQAVEVQSTEPSER